MSRDLFILWISCLNHLSDSQYEVMNSNVQSMLVQHMVCTVVQRKLANWSLVVRDQSAIFFSYCTCTVYVRYTFCAFGNLCDFEIVLHNLELSRLCDHFEIAQQSH